MNILEHSTFDADTSGIIPIKESSHIRQFAVALGQNGMLKKHKTTVPATLLVLKGEINFIMDGEEIVLGEMDVYEIPVEKEHEVVGILQQNLFLITKEL